MNLYKVGIDVGGTFTKAVIIDSASKIVSKGITPTTYNSTNSIADGIIRSLRIALSQIDIDASNISLVAFSTTHTVNALLEGDTSIVGVIALSPSRYAKITIKRTRIGNIKITDSKKLEIVYRFINTDNESYIDNVEQTVRELSRIGIRSFVVTSPFSTENPEIEKSAAEVIRGMGYIAVCGHEMTNLYGLEVRTITAAINASILPKMIKVADSVERGVRSLGIKAPIMVMRGDGGITSLDVLRKKPLQTVLSGPAASVVGALQFLKIDDGVFIEVGGTSTNIGVVRNGRPLVSYLKVMDYPTSVRSINVHIGGVAGGSMVRVRDRKILDVGPRSAHIAGLQYSSFTEPRKLKNLELEFISPRNNDPNDYVVVKNIDTGERYAITTTCAANALGIIPDNDFAKGYVESARSALKVLGDHIGYSVEETAEAILRKAAENIYSVLKHAAKESNIKLSNTLIIGGGGAASVIVPYLAKLYGFSYRMSVNPSYISAIGMVIGLVKDEVEIPIHHAQNSSLGAIINNAVEEIYDSLMSKGANPETITIDIEYDHSKSAVRISGAGYVKGAGDSRSIKIKNRSGILDALSRNMNIDGRSISIVGENRYYYIVSIDQGSNGGSIFRFINRRSNERSIVIVDKWGNIRLKLNNASIVETDRDRVVDAIKRISRSWIDLKEIYIVYGARIIDLSAILSINSWNAGDMFRDHHEGVDRDRIYIIHSR